jgi:multisubunit Na+/H+ antiporter MnhG subunit
MEDMMKKQFWLISLIFMLTAVFTLPAFAYNDFYAQVVKRDNTATGNIALTPITTGITFQVLDAGTNTISTLTKFADNSYTSVTNPVTTTVFAVSTGGNGNIKFRNANTTVDIIVTDTNGGYSAVVKGFSLNMHTIVIDETPNMPHHGIIWFAPSTSETSTGVSFVPDTFVSDVRVQVITTDSAKTIAVGLLSSQPNGSATGFITGLLMTTAGYVADTAVSTKGSNGQYVPASTYGAFLYTSTTGTDSANVDLVGGKTYLGYIVTGSNATTISYTGSGGTSTAAGYIHYWFTRMK